MWQSITDDTTAVRNSKITLYEVPFNSPKKFANTLLEKSRIILPEKVVKSLLRQKRRKQMRFSKSYLPRYKKNVVKLESDNLNRISIVVFFSHFQFRDLKFFPHLRYSSGIEPECSASEPSAIQIRQDFVHDLLLKLRFILKSIDTFCSKMQLASRVLWDVFYRRKSSRLSKSIFFFCSMGMVTIFKL